MHAFNEVRIGNQSAFERHVLDEDGNSLIVTTTRIPMHTVERDRKKVFLIYDDDMRVISNAYAYLNKEILASSPKSRAKAAYALRFLYCFLALSGIRENELDDSHVRELQQFLQGVGTVTSEYALETQRRNNTANGYFAIYRKYYKSLGIDCDALFRFRKASVETWSGVEPVRPVSINRFESNLPGKAYCERTVPKYISPDDFQKLYRIAIDDGNATAKIIMHLMYGYAMRLGEVLGLTTEDIVEKKINGSYAPVLIIRNRRSDRDFQYAKGRKHVLTQAEYKTDAYVDSWQEIVLDYSMYEKLVDYINDTHERAMDKYPDNYAEGSADVVSSYDAPDSNHYVFLNRYGRVLSGQTWGNALKDYFERAEIQRDWDLRKDNLSHRFRHGFAMFHAHFSPHPVDVIRLQKWMRHKWLSSTMVYFNPTIEDEVKMKAAFQDDLYDMIPELKAGLRGH